MQVPASRVAETVDGLSYGAVQTQGDMQVGFMELGLDSVDVVQLIDRLNSRLPSCHLEPTAVFEHPTPAALAAHLFEQPRSRREAELPKPTPPPAPRRVSAARSVLQEYQLWPHGYVGAATLHAMRRALEVLVHPHTLQALAAVTGANEGHLAVALRTLVALGWVTVGESKTYAAPAATVAAAKCAALAELCEAVYQDSPGLVLRLARMLQEADDGWPGFAPDEAAPPGLRTMLTGAVLARC